MIYSRTTIYLILGIAIICTSFTNPISQDLPELSPEEMTVIATKVLDDLKQAKGILPTEPPFLKVREFTGSIKLAVFYKDLNEIHLDSLSYEIMRYMGKDSSDALAFLLGHELGHYLYKHKKINHAIHDATPGLMSSAAVTRLVEHADTTTAGEDFGEKLTAAVNNYNDTYDEAQADFEGGFLGYLAGYQPMAAGKEFLKQAYDHPFMNLTRKSRGYPSYRERLGVIEKTAEELERLVPLFEMANYLIALEQYYDAVPYLERVLEKFQSREIYNNIGVATLLEIQRLFERPPTDYKFPLTLDASFRLPHPNLLEGITDEGLDIILGWTKYKACQLNLAQMKIKIAEDYFKKAIALDSKYETAYLNLSIAQTIKALLYNTSNRDAAMCGAERYEGYSSALSTATKAKNIVESHLKDHAVWSFSKNDFSSENFQVVTRRDTVENGDIFEMTTIVPDVSADPFKKQLFGTETLIRENIDSNLITDSTSWFNPRRISISLPDKAYNLSNIHTQIDIIHILRDGIKDGKIKKMDPEIARFVNITPFATALEVNHKNELAKYNMHLAQKGHIPVLDNILNDSCNSTKERFENKSVQEYLSESNTWILQETFPSTKLLYFESEEQYGNTRSKLNMKYVETEDYKLYSNVTEIGLNNRMETSTFLSPNNFSRLSTSCDISIGSHMKELVSKYGVPVRVVTMTTGTYATFLFSSSRVIRGETDTMTIDENENQRPMTFEVNDESLMPSDVRSIDNTESHEHGVIFKLDKENRVKRWTIYHKEIKTGLFEA